MLTRQAGEGEEESRRGYKRTVNVNGTSVLSVRDVDITREEDNCLDTAYVALRCIDPFDQTYR